MPRILIAAALLLVVLPSAARASGVGGVERGREVVLVANAEGGTVSIVDARAFVVLRTIDILPDGPTADDPLQAAARQPVVEAAGGTNYAQDQDVSPDGRTLYVSRGHRGDVAAFDLTTGALQWKLAVPGFRSDHMTISDDGRLLFVSALTENVVVVIDTDSRTIVASYRTGQWPHDNHLSDDGKRLYNASIGTIVAPEESRGALGPPPYRLSVFDVGTGTATRTYDFEAGIRPIVVAHDERRMWAQLSELHGVVEFDLEGGRISRRLELPIDPGVTEADYDFEAPHHGLAVSPDEETLCIAGRASDYVALVSTSTLTAEAIIDAGDAPGWAATGPDGKHCFVPNTREDTLSVVSYARRREVARLGVGDGPKQIEAARLPEDVVCSRGVPGCGPVRLTRHCPGGGRLLLRVDGDTLSVGRVVFRLGGRVVGRDGAAPFRALVPRSVLVRTRARRIRAMVSRAGATRALTRRMSRCGLPSGG